MNIKHRVTGIDSRKLQTSVKQGDIVLVNFGREGKGSRNLCGNHPVYVMSRQSEDKRSGAIMAIPLFRKVSRDGSGSDIEIAPTDCHGLRYSEYAQPMNIQKIRRDRIIRRIGHVREGIHERILSAMWEQVDSYKEGLIS